MGERFYWRAPDVDQLSAFGLTLDDVAPAAIDVWPDHVTVLEVFKRMGTQWRTGMNGAVGLDYQPLPFIFRMLKIPKSEWGQVLDDMRVIELAALNQIHRK